MTLTRKEKNISVYVLHEQAIFEYAETKETIRGVWTTRKAAEKYIANAQRHLKQKWSKDEEERYSLDFWIEKFELDKKNSDFGNRVRGLYYYFV